MDEKYTSTTADNVIGKKIKARRKALKMTQMDLAYLIGVSFQQVQKYENGNNRISMTTFLNICEGLHVNPSYFFDTFSFREESSDEDEDMEKKLIEIFRRVNNKKVKIRIIKLVDAISSDLEEDNL